MRQKTVALSLLLCVGLLASASMASAYYYSNWGHNVRPAGAGKYLRALPLYVEPGQGGFGITASWYSSSNNTATNSPGGNTWSRAGGYCNGGTWVDSGWVAPNTSARFGGTASVWCPRGFANGPQDSWGMVASDAYSSFTY